MAIASEDLTRLEIAERMPVWLREKNPKPQRTRNAECTKKSLRLSGVLLISACPGFLFDEAVAMEHRRWLVVMPRAVCFRFPLFVLWFGQRHCCFLSGVFLAFASFYLFSERPVSQ
jgi:hypothetical protein